MLKRLYSLVFGESKNNSRDSDDYEDQEASTHEADFRKLGGGAVSKRRRVTFADEGTGRNR